MKTFGTVNLPILGAFWKYGSWLRWLVLVAFGGGLSLFPTHPILATFPIMIALLIPAFFRCPHCIEPPAGTLVSPVSGRIDDLEEVSEIPSCGGAGTRIGIFLSICDVHVTRAPVTGQVVAKNFIPGRAGNAISRHCGNRNQRNEILIETAAHEAVFMKQISGAIARRVIFDPEPGDKMTAGAIVGMIRFGSRAEIFIPKITGFRIHANLGDRVEAGRTIIATI